MKIDEPFYEPVVRKYRAAVFDDCGEWIVDIQIKKSAFIDRYLNLDLLIEDVYERICEFHHELYQTEER